MTRCFRNVVLLFMISLLYYFIHPPASQAIEDGRTLAQKVYNRDDGKDSYAKIQMVLIDKRGEERLRSMVTAIKDDGNLSKRYIRFTDPASINGTAFLAWENADRPDDQFLYLPALGRVRRIAVNQKNQQFVNTDFTYEDLEKRQVDTDTHTILRSETCAQYECWVLESIPKDTRDSQYGKLVSWIAKDIFVPVKVEYYNKKNKLTKRFLVHKLENIDGIWTIMESEMHDLDKNHRTRIITLGIRYNTNIPDRVFTREYLEQPQ